MGGPSQTDDPRELEPETDHKCPVDGCFKRVPYEQLMCQRHWYQIPPRLRAKVWSTWRQSLIAEHREAMTEAIEHVNGLVTTPKGNRQQ